MQLTSILLSALSLASTLTASPVPAEKSIQARSAAGCFEVTQFRNSGSPHSISATVYLAVTDASTGLAATCSAVLSIQPSIVTTQFPTVCNDTSVFFGFEYKPGVPGYWLTLAHLYNGNQTVDSGSVWMGGDIRRYDNPSGNPNGDFDYLNYPAEFSVGYNRHIQELPTTTSAAGSSPTA
ncbi:hypothetical protein H072_3440 [Dactylellina haptotyla CBS 200.50]|uniref:Carboxylic ester hydrolase n=1 Tax=Dactylellina haptotyla (strain CBS 200.50) TaxID=1284197 RepID=S8AN51_DACHA|nr:hypothetical protein H072_3440 [Dactylellina haptotyla CBS 200.50]